MGSEIYRLQRKGLFGNFGMLAVLLALGIMSFLRFALNHTPSQLFVFAMLYAIFAFDVLYVKSLIDKGVLKLSALLKLVGMSVVAGVVLEGLTVLGSPASHFSCLADWSKRRVVVFVIGAFLVLQYAYLKHQNSDSAGERAIGARHFGYRKLGFAIFILCMIVLVVSRIGMRFPLPFYVFDAAVLCIVFYLLVRKSISLPLTFFMLAFVSGSMLICALPVTTGLSWDDQVHYENAVNVSYLFQSQFTETDLSFIADATNRGEGVEAPSIVYFDSNEITQHSYVLDSSYRDDVVEERVVVRESAEAIYGLNSIGYAPLAVGLWLGRLLHLGFSSTVLLAKLCGLLCFSALIASAIAVSPSKKGLFAFVGLLPSCLWLATNFSYDAWLIAMVMLGFAYYLRYAWGEKDDFTRKNILLAFVFTFAGLAVKAVYFPVIGLYFLVPKDRFSDVGQRRRYNAAVFFLGFFTFASFALPYLFTVQGDAGDTRGGADINPAKQIAFILNDPIGYALILFRFFWSSYFAPLQSFGYTLSFAYLGDVAIAFSGLPGSTLLLYAPAEMLQYIFDGRLPGSTLLLYAPATAFVFFGLTANDSISVRHTSVWASLWALFLMLFAFALVATALYVSFTPVGLGTVNGCQTRYILPMLVPSLTIILNNKWLAFGEKRGWLLTVFCISLAFFAICFTSLILVKVL